MQECFANYLLCSCQMTSKIWRIYCNLLLLPCFRWRQQPPGWLRWSCPTWCDCSLEEMEELAADSGKIWFISNRKNRLHKIPRVEWTGDDLPSWPLTTHYHDKPTIMRAYMADLYRKVVLLSGYQLLSARLAVLHQNSGGIGKSIPSALQISLDSWDFPRAK